MNFYNRLDYHLNKTSKREKAKKNRRKGFQMMNQQPDCEK